VGLDDPAAFAEAFHTATAETVEPFYRATLTSDRHRLGETEAGIRGVACDSPDAAYQQEKALGVAFAQDPECVRASLDIRFVLQTPEEVFARPGWAARPSGWDLAGAKSSRSAPPGSSSSRWFPRRKGRLDGTGRRRWSRDRV
jgi:hypothetical protein